ncbi:poly(A) RNA polymerase GLD2 [Lissotriton helveticus]
MYPNSPKLGRAPYPAQVGDLLGKMPLSLGPAIIAQHQKQLMELKNTRAFLSGSLGAVSSVSAQAWPYGNGGRLSLSPAPPSTFQGIKFSIARCVKESPQRAAQFNLFEEIGYYIDNYCRDGIHHNASDDCDHGRLSVSRIQDILAGNWHTTLVIKYSIEHLRLVGLQLGESTPVNIGPEELLFDTLGAAGKKHVNPIYTPDPLSLQILELFQACQQQAGDLKKKDICRAELQREIQQMFPHSRLYLVGSSLNGFGTRGSDADLCLVMQEELVNQETEARQILGMILKYFYNRLAYIEKPQLIRAKVPIVKFRDKVSGVEFDLNVNNVVGIRNTFLLRTYAHIENRVRPLVLVVKQWATHFGINDASRGTLSSYTLVLMVVHYLQTLPEPILPSLQRKYPECFAPTMQLNLVPQAPSHIPPYFSKNGSSLGDLFVGFLKYFATEFDWNKHMISVREAKVLPRPDRVEWRNKFICVEEPFDGSNTARAVHEKQKFELIQEAFQKSYNRIKDKKDLNGILPLRATISGQKR